MTCSRRRSRSRSNSAILGKQSPEPALSKAAANASKLMEQNLQKFGA